MKRNIMFTIFGVIIIFLVFSFCGCGSSGNTNTPPSDSPSDGGTTTDTYTYAGGWGSEGNEGGQFKHPVRLTLNGNDAYVIDWGDCVTIMPRIQKLSAADGSFQSYIGSHVDEDGQFKLPYDVKIREGMIYVVDAELHCVLRFNETTGQYLGWLGKAKEDGTTGWHNSGTSVAGKEDGAFSAPNAIAFDSAGNMYVADMGNHRIQKYDPDGKFLGWWGKDSADGHGWHDPGSNLEGAPGSGEGEFDQPCDVAVGPGDCIYVIDNFNRRVQKFTSDGRYVKQWGGFSSTYALCVDSDGFVYVLNVGGVSSPIVKKFNADGDLLAAWGEYGYQAGQFQCPTDVDVDAAGQVYVVDAEDHRVKIFRAP